MPSVWLPNTVVKSLHDSVKTVAVEGSWLLACVPMPNTTDPVTEAALPETAGSSTITPLLSVGNSTTGLVTWLVSAANAGLQVVPEHV